MRLLQIFLLSVTAVPAMAHETGAVHVHGAVAIAIMALAVTLSVYYLCKRS